MLEYGVHLPLVDLGAGLSLRRLQDCAHAAVALGYRYVCANDHLLFRRPWLDGLTALAAVIRESGDLTLATTVSLPVIRGPVQLAKTLAASSPSLLRPPSSRKLREPAARAVRPAPAPARRRPTASPAPRGRPRAGSAPSGCGRPPSGGVPRAWNGPSQACCVLDHPDRALDAGRSHAVGDVERDQEGEARVAHRRHGRVRGESFRKHAGGRLLTRESGLERLETAVHEPRGVRRGDDPGEAACQVEAFPQLGVARDGHPCEHIVVPGEDLRGGVDDDVGTVVEWAQPKRCRHRGVADRRARDASPQPRGRASSEAGSRAPRGRSGPPSPAAGRSGRTRRRSHPTARGGRTGHGARSRRPRRARPCRRGAASSARPS